MKQVGMENGITHFGSENNEDSIPRPLSVEFNRRKLVLHFDIRNTVLVADSVTNVRIEQALNSYLTGVTWGKENEKGDWEWLSDVPSPKAPCADAITYYKYKEKELVKIPSDRALLRQVTGDFTSQPIGKRFKSFYKKILSRLEWPHKSTDPKLTMEGQDGLLYHYILPSFLKLLQHLHDNRRDFAIILRTYGMDATNVLEFIDYSLKGNHPRFKDLHLPYKVNKMQGKIVRSSHDSITLHTHDNSVCLSNERDIYEYLSNSEGISGFVDDFIFWQNNDYNFLSAKPHWIDLLDTKTHHIFFDDNLRVTDTDSIVNVRMLPTKSSSNKVAQSMDLKETIDLENVCLVLADLLQSTEDMDYFVKRLNECEDNYEEFLQKAFL